MEQILGGKQLFIACAQEAYMQDWSSRAIFVYPSSPNRDPPPSAPNRDPPPPSTSADDVFFRKVQSVVMQGQNCIALNPFSPPPLPKKFVQNWSIWAIFVQPSGHFRDPPPSTPDWDPPPRTRPTSACMALGPGPFIKKSLKMDRDSFQINS